MHRDFTLLQIVFCYSAKGYGLRCCYNSINKELIYTAQEPSGRSYLFEYPMTPIGTPDYLPFNLVELAGWYACCSQNPASERCARFAESRAIRTDCAQSTPIGSGTSIVDFPTELNLRIQYSTVQHLIRYTVHKISYESLS